MRDSIIAQVAYFCSALLRLALCVRAPALECAPPPTTRLMRRRRSRGVDLINNEYIKRAKLRPSLHFLPRSVCRLRRRRRAKRRRRDTPRSGSGEPRKCPSAATQISARAQAESFASSHCSRARARARCNRAEAISCAPIRLANRKWPSKAATSGPLRPTEARALIGSQRRSPS